MSLDPYVVIDPVIFPLLVFSGPPRPTIRGLNVTFGYFESSVCVILCRYLWDAPEPLIMSTLSCRVDTMRHPAGRSGVALTVETTCREWSTECGQGGGLVEKTEAHVIVGLLFLCKNLLVGCAVGRDDDSKEHPPSSFSSSLGASAAAPPAAAPPAAAPPPPPDGTEASLVLPSEISCHQLVSTAKMLRSRTWAVEPVRRTSLISLPLSSERSVFSRSSSASMPTDSSTALISLADGEVLPPRPRRR